MYKKSIKSLVKEIASIQKNKNRSPEDAEKYRILSLSDEEFRREFLEESAIADAYFKLKMKNR